MGGEPSLAVVRPSSGTFLFLPAQNPGLFPVMQHTWNCLSDAKLQTLVASYANSCPAGSNSDAPFGYHL